MNSEIKNENIFHINVLHGNLNIIYVYKPPKTDWPDPPLPGCQQPALITRDFNSQHTEWGCPTNDKAGEKSEQLGKSKQPSPLIQPTR